MLILPPTHPPTHPPTPPPTHTQESSVSIVMNLVCNVVFVLEAIWKIVTYGTHFTLLALLAQNVQILTPGELRVLHPHLQALTLLALLGQKYKY
jgi:hypothetical protein